MDFEKLLKHIDGLLFTQNLRPEDQDRLYVFRGGVELAMERQARVMAFNALSEAFRKNLEMQNPNFFMGERLLGGPRFEFPREFSHAGPEVILPGELQTPAQSEIRDFVPNTSYQDRMNLDPGRLEMMREKDRRRQRRI